jgi:glucose-6-phosphate isomerase
MAVKNQIAKKLEEHRYPVINMGLRLREMEKILSDFERRDIVNRIWHKDHTVWKPNPEEIGNRLGWLQVVDLMDEIIPELERFAMEIKDGGFHHVVLLGMGGSSLGPEVLRQTFGNAPGYPPLLILDSTVPAQIESVVKLIEPKHTLFVVSSKSGTTIETLSLYRYFRNLVEKEAGRAKAGANFVAITDESTPLEGMSVEEHFRKVFLNPSDVGGRYSVLSYFGLVPAVLTGVDVKKVIESANKMQESCAPCADIHDNPGLWLGALTGSFAIHGRDKLTLVTSPSIKSFGLWVEQLLAESTGKEGRGIIPIIDEPLLDPQYYGDDRLFVYLRMKGDENSEADEAITRLEITGQPIIQIEINDQNDLGAEFFRWEFATAVAGIVLGINPFDQPDVKAAKDATRKVLEALQTSPKAPGIPSCGALSQWLEQARPDNYLAFMAYLKQTPAVDRAFALLRRRITEKYSISTTVGYGPRFLHSTGQLHKGGPNKGLSVQITANRSKDVNIPGKNYTFGMLTEAELQGDYRALKGKRRKVIRIQLCNSSGASVERLLPD